ncbi:MAG: peptide chain release factor N(5)-glutamine methyltransferase [Muribaculaceae bacterium]|nr:peptide chain release factor N(5)-glutamine methyltransferase [Muribaculaceae bacterium]
MTRLIFAALKGWSVTDMLIHANTILSDIFLSRLENILHRLDRHEPLQYILGQARFYGMDFTVNPSVLIPRPETEELVDIIVGNNRERKDLRVLDVGTGSGCIAIALARHLPFARVTAIDISPEALDVARENARRLKTGITFIQADILAIAKEGQPADSFDIIVSNPPYIARSEAADMDSNVLDYEPHTALFVPDDDPLLYYTPIADIARRTLSEGGQLYFEINPRYAEDIVAMLADKGFTDITVCEDISHRPRFVTAILAAGQQ